MTRDQTLREKIAELIGMVAVNGTNAAYAVQAILQLFAEREAAYKKPVLDKCSGDAGGGAAHGGGPYSLPKAGE